jgi:hypothetical protein
VSGNVSHFSCYHSHIVCFHRILLLCFVVFFDTVLLIFKCSFYKHLLNYLQKMTFNLRSSNCIDYNIYTERRRTSCQNRQRDTNHRPKILDAQKKDGEYDYT